MSKFIIIWATGNEQCVNCSESIKSGEKCVKLEQNRWAKPIICKSCLEKILIQLNSKSENINNNFGDKKITYKQSKVSKNGWMGGW